MDVYETIKAKLETIIGEFDILSGDTVGPSGASWQDVAGTCAVNLRSLASFLDSVRGGTGRHADRFPITGPVVFPSLREIANDSD